MALVGRWCLTLFCRRRSSRGWWGRVGWRFVAPPSCHSAASKVVIPAEAGIQEIGAKGIDTMPRGVYRVYRLVVYAGCGTHKKGSAKYVRSETSVPPSMLRGATEMPGLLPSLRCWFTGRGRLGADAVVIDYDVDDDGLIEVSDLAQLNAMRWDLDGDGSLASTATITYGAVFPGCDVATSTLMGCPLGECVGYELVADLTFPASGLHSTWTPAADLPASIPPLTATVIPLSG